ncbi:phosphonate ABC transporter, permease protein PhnE, partial [Burkholderia multivorans]
MTQSKAELLKHYGSPRTKLKYGIISVVIIALLVWAFAGMPALEIKQKSQQILGSIMHGLT